ncbi:MAG TPA: TonB-dependent receptor [Terracidiphilus sp.]|jgi:hypothetical protein
MRRIHPLAATLLLAASIPAFATVFATVHGVVHDPQHRPIGSAEVTLQAADSTFVLTAKTTSEGEFELPQAPIGVYTLKIAATNFATTEQTITVASGTNPVLHILMSVAPTTQTVIVLGHESSLSASDSVTPTTLITRADIELTPGANRTIGMEMITDYVPGAYMTHDMLHMRGGHQTSWLIDGIAIPNTKIASNVGPQIDPKDIDSLETQRGSYDSEIGDRTYGVFNVLPRNGFEYNRDGEFLLTGGNFGTGEAQLSLGDHSPATAWYASLTGGRSSYGLATPVSAVDHDATNSQSGFVSLIRNQTPKDQLRLNAQYRQDHFDVPYDPSLTDWQALSNYYSSYGLRDAQTERDSFVIANWVHTLSPRALFSIAPFYHLNQANYDSLPTDYPAATTWHQGSNYVGGQGDVHVDAGPNNFSGGMYTFYQAESDLFGVIDNTTSPSTVYGPDLGTAGAALVEGYLSDHLRLGQYATLLGGMRFSSYHAGLNESATYPRIGATVEIPRLHWVLRGFYGHFFQPAPLETVSSSVLNYASSLPNGENTFAPIPSERDEEHQFGIQIPYKGWLLDVATVKNRVNNFLDHSNLGESNMYFPIAVNGALVRAWELTLRSPQLAHAGQFHVTYSNQIAQQRGAIIGGFTCTNPNDPACTNGGFNYISLDHDQRDTLNAGFTSNLPLHTWFSTNVYYGSGFSNGLACTDPSSCPNNGPYDGPYLPVHTTFDVSAGHSLGERWKLAVNVINATNHRILLDNSITIGGFHYNDPRMFSAELRYRFHF